MSTNSITSALTTKFMRRTTDVDVRIDVAALLKFLQHYFLH